MLILSRKKDQAIKIGPDVEIVVVEIRSGCVKLGVRAPADVHVNRAEVRATRDQVAASTITDPQTKDDAA